ncbi:MAG: putative minor capsid protein [Mycoplasmatales bacterium]
MIPQIPIDLLNDNITLKSYIKGEQEFVFRDDEIIENVKVELNHNLTMDNGSNQEEINTTLFVDAVNSKYSNLENFTLQSQVIFNDNIYTIEKVEVLRVHNNIHHLEVTLC